jgi:hypothetical protein
VLPVLTHAKDGHTNPTVHFGSFAMMDAGAINPYTFNGNIGFPVSYFRFRDLPRFPSPFWYQDHDPPRDWSTILPQFEYLLVQLPIDWARFPARGELVATNGAAALLRNLDYRPLPQARAASTNNP